jgi:hypothetical protein
MKQDVQPISLLGIIVALWGCLWMLTIPLFHVHPGLDHRHGGEVHTHDVVVHTVLSSDLDGEFDHPHDGDWQEEASSEVALVDHQSHSLSDHPEVGFSLFNDSSGPRISKAQSTHAIVIDATLVSNSDLHTWLDPDPVPIRGSTILVHKLRSRAPPILLV